MKAWIKKLSGIFLASLLATQLTGKAFADLEPQPEEPKTEISEPAPAAEAPSIPAAPANETPTAVTEPPAVVDAPKETPSQAADEPANVTPTLVEEAPAKEETAQPAEAQAADIKQTEDEVHVKDETAQNNDAPVSSEDEQIITPAADLEENIPAAAAADTDEVPAADELAVADTEKQAATEKPAEITEELLQEEAADDADIPVSEEPAAADLEDIKKAATRKLSSAAMLLTSSGDTADSEETVTLRSAPAGNEGEKDGEKDPAGDPSEDKSSGESETKGSSTAQNNPILVADDGTFVLVNHSGTEQLSAEEGDLKVLAAGFNKITSLSASGSVNITGTGIMLIDSLTGSLALNTFNDIYTSGSVALFVKQDNDDSYVLRNGAVPGILDEEYKVEGYKLVIPNGSSLNMIGTGAMMLVKAENYVPPDPDAGPDELVYDEVVYYHGSDHSYVCYDYKPPEGKVVAGGTESAGKLTIGAGAELVIEQGGSVVMQDLKSYNGYGSKKMPELIFADGGQLTVNGSLGSEGVVKFGGTDVLSGSSTITADRIIIDTPAAVNGTGVTFSSPELLINGSGELSGLKINSSNVYPRDNGITLTGLVSSGESSVVLPDAFTLNISRVDGALHLMQRRYLQNTDLDDIPAENMVNPGSGGQTNKRGNFYGETGYSDEYANTISGSISGSGTISFDSGIFKLINLSKVSGISFSNAYGGLVYDYSNVMPAAVSPIHLQLSDVERADDNNGVIPVVAVTCEESRNPYSAYTLGGYGLGNGMGIRWGTKELTLLNTTELEEIQAEYITGGWCIKEEQLINLAKNNIPETDGYKYWGILVELLHKTDSESGETFNSMFIPPQTLTGDGDGYIFADGVCLVRIYYVYDIDEVAGGGEALQTSTSHTGTGILGGLSGNLSVYNDPSSNPDPDPVVPDPDPVVPDPVVPDPVTPDPVVPDPVVPDPTVPETVAAEPVTVQAPVVAQGEKPPEEVLFWVEEQSGSTTAASSPQSAAASSSTQAAAASSATQTPAAAEADLPALETYVLNAAAGEKTLEEQGGTVTVTMKYTPPSVTANKPLYVVFIDEDGSITAMKASYSVLTKQLKFTTDRLGTFTVIGFEFSGYEFSDEFYEALAKIPELMELIESLKN